MKNQQTFVSVLHTVNINIPTTMGIKLQVTSLRTNNAVLTQPPFHENNGCSAIIDQRVAMSGKNWNIHGGRITLFCDTYSPTRVTAICSYL
jgi:hypothetical protein